MNTEHGEHREIARLIGDLQRAERERDDLAATLETRTAEHARRMGWVRELEAVIAAMRTRIAHTRALAEERESILDDARADYAAVAEYLGGIVRVWQRASDDDRRMADTFVSGLRREIEEARDSARGEWWEVCRGGNPAPLRTELAAIRAQLAAVTAERDALRAECDGEHDLIARQAAILTAVADALKGTPPALSSHSHHDLGAVAAATVAERAPLVACVDALRAAARDAGWRDADATGETLVAWVRRGAMTTAAGIADDHGRAGVASAIRLAAIDLTGGE